MSIFSKWFKGKKDEQPEADTAPAGPDAGQANPGQASPGEPDVAREMAHEEDSSMSLPVSTSQGVPIPQHEGDDVVFGFETGTISDMHGIKFKDILKKKRDEESDPE